MFGILISLIFSPLGALVSFVQSSSFPQPLNEAEEKLQLEHLFSGDPEARRILIERNLRLVAHVVKKFERGSESAEDLISIGVIGLIKAIDSYTPDRGTRLSTYAARCIENEIRMFFRSKKKRRSEVSLQDPIGSDGEGNELMLMDILKTGDDVPFDLTEQKLFKDQVHQALERMDEREREVILRRYGLLNGVRETQQKIAEDMNISRSYVSRIEKKALEKLKTELERHNGRQDG